MTGPVDILILGDSALASLGGVFSNAVDMMAAQGEYEREVRFENGSAVGMTAADAWWHFLRATRRQHFDAVIVYAGNCDACGHGYVKPPSPRALAALVSRGSTAWFRRRSSLARRNPPLQFVAHDLAARPMRRCVTPGAAAGFIRKIATQAGARRQHVFVVCAASNLRFPPANNTGNGIFYKIFGVREFLTYRAEGSASRLVEALHLHRALQLDAAAALYAAIAQEHRDTELGAIAANNSAAICFDRADYDAAARLLDTGTPPPAPLRPLLLFNRAVLAEATGDPVRALDLFQQAREADAGTYRVTSAYHAALSQLQDSRYLHRIDLCGVLGDTDFMDYCHPTEDGHRKVAAHLRAAIESQLHLAPGSRRPQLISRPLNPDAYAGARGGFFEYFNVVPAADPVFAAAVLAQAVAEPYAETLERDAFGAAGPRDRTIARILAHPLCGTPGFLRASPPVAAVDQGALPELYALRHLQALYGRLHERPEVARALGEAARLLPQPERLAAWWPSLGAVPCPEDAELAAVAGRLDTAAILSRVAHLLRTSLARGPVVCARLRTITYWFLREAMLFGTASHPSMYFDRVTFQNIANTGLFVLWHSAGSQAGDECRGLMQVAGAAVGVHLRHLTPWANRVYAMPPAQLESYRRELAALLTSPVLRRPAPQ